MLSNCGILKPDFSMRQSYLPISSCLVVLLFILIFTTSATAQIHLKVGYTPGYYDPPENNRLLKQYNEDNPWLETKFDGAKWLHGLDVGVRYKIGPVGIEASWRASFTNDKAEGKNPVTNANVLNKLIYRYNQYSVGLENHIGRFGLGASLNYDRLSMITKNNSDRDDLLKTQQWTGTLFVGLYTDHYNGISFGLRPYVQLPLSQFDITPLATHFGESTTEPLLEKDYMVFGISLLIFNGF